jgi:hypothetical protein
VVSKQTDVCKAFDEVHSHAQWESGSGGYTGTIAEKTGYTVLTRTPLGPAELDALVQKHDNNDKWGPCYAAPVAEATLGKEKVVTVRAKSATEARTVAEKRLKGQDFKVKEVKALGVAHTNKMRRTKHGGKPKIKWAFNGGRDTLYDKPLDAVKAAEAHLAWRSQKVDSGEWSHWGLDSSTYLVYPVAVLIDNDGPKTQNGTGASYTVSIGRDDKAASWEVTVVLRKVDTAKCVGWAFWGWASS